ncbi:expressed unknown protein [Seminavis robusta]|uniref:Uncharacterized protein n=1 Tax=Seminavis robusta TaxID=568900 RepID=A0A9N8E5U8_9STRA|nr:expressed unknown protein [Seminavis robusta]|eukprot:Sro702_g189980.1 n/a (403) ;mRNA; r:32247-33455
MSHHRWLLTILLVVVLLCSRDCQAATSGSLEEEATCPQSSSTTTTGSCTSRQDKDVMAQAADFHAFIRHMFDTIDAHAATLTKPDLRAQESLILTTWLNYFGMDPAVITQTPAPENWLETVYMHTKQLAPSLFFKVWDERARPTQEEIQVLLAIDDSAAVEAARQEHDYANVLMNYLFMEFRHRGFTMALLDTFCRVMLGPLKTVAYAIPSQQNIDLIAQYEPLIEVGAGTGYWSAILQRQNVTITPYDADPPQEEGGIYFDRTYTHVQKGTCLDVFHKDNNKNIMTNHTLLLVWPNNPDNVDNAPEFHSSRLPPVWDTACVQAFLEAGGTTVILVAEREDNIHILPSHPQNPTQPDSGLCATRALQTLLRTEFDLVHQMDIPTWYYSDDLTVWVKKTESKK